MVEVQQWWQIHNEMECVQNVKVDIFCLRCQSNLECVGEEMMLHGMEGCMESYWNGMCLECWGGHILSETLAAISKGFTAILVVVDRFTKQSIFMPTYNTITSAQLAELFIVHVFSKHGVPSHVMSDRSSKFVSHFFRSLGKALDMKLHFTSGYHPKGDGQTECVNQTLEQYLCIFTNYQQDNWSSLLPLAEFSYNNALNATTGVSPFFANKGYDPSITIHPEYELASSRAHQCYNSFPSMNTCWTCLTHFCPIIYMFLFFFVSWTCIFLGLFISTTTCRLHASLLHAFTLPCTWGFIVYKLVVIW